MEEVTVTNKEVAEVKIGRYSVTLDKEKLGTLHGFCDSAHVEIGEIREMADMLLDMCFGIYPPEADCLKYMKYLRCIRTDYETLQNFGVKFEQNA